MSPTTRRLTVSDWEAEIGREREPRDFAADASALDVLKQRFRDISARTRHHRQSAWINRPGFAVIKKISDHALELTRLAFHELSQFDTPHAATIPLHSLSQLLMENQSRLAEIDAQRGSLETMIAAAELFRAPLEILVDGGTTPLRAWRGLIGELQAGDLPRTLDADGVWPGSLLDGCLEAEVWPHAWFYAPAVHRALWIVKLRQLLPELPLYPLDVLILPALLADSGLLVIHREFSRSLAGAPLPSSPGFARHPEISGALINRIDGASPLSAVLASQHHERIDGTGFPRRLRLEELNLPSRCFAIIARWSELVGQSASSASSADVRTHAARTLSREAWQGAFDVPLVERLLSALQLGGSQAQGNADEKRSKAFRHFLDQEYLLPWGADSAAPVRIIDGAQSTPPPARMNSRISAFKETGPGSPPTPPPRPAVSGYR